MAGKTQNESTGGMDAANLFKPALVWGKLRSMGATTLAEYREYIEKDGALERRFAMVMVNEPSVRDTLSILRGIRKGYEAYHKVEIRDAALVTSANLAHRYLTQRRLPDSAIDLIDEACTSVRVTRDTLPEDIDLLERQKVRLQVDIQSLEEAKVDNDPGVLNQIQDVRNELTKVEYEIDGFNHYNKGRVERRNAMVKLRKQIAEARIEQRDFAKRGEVEENNTLGQKISEYSAELRELENQVHDPELSCITAEHIAAVVERITRIPLQRLIVTDKETCWVIGQPEAVHAVAQAIRRSRNGLNDETRPIALFLFTGISGTGKTHLSKMLAEIMFQTQDAMIRIDGSEYSEAHSPSRLIGSPPGYVGHDQGGHLTEYIRRHPYSIVLIDEIEEASEEFHTLFLQVLDDGRLTDGKGRVVDFRNTILVMTSNLGSQHLSENAGDSYEDSRRLVVEAVEDYFPTEFINRLDDIIVFRALTPKEGQEIATLRLEVVRQLLPGRKLTLDVDETARQVLGKAVSGGSMGARPLNRMIQHDIVNEISTLLLRNRIKEGEIVKVRARDGRTYVEPNHTAGIADSQMPPDNMNLLPVSLPTTNPARPSPTPRPGTTASRSLAAVRSARGQDQYSTRRIPATCHAA